MEVVVVIVVVVGIVIGVVGVVDVVVDVVVVTTAAALFMKGLFCNISIHFRRIDF